jgi:hypothetical protein
MHRHLRKAGPIWAFAAALCGTAQFALSATANPLPPHWYVSGTNPPQAKMDYSGELDHSVAYEGTSSGLLRSNSSTAQSGTLMQMSSASPYRGKKIKLKAFLRSRDVTRRAGLWIRADGADGATVAFRNCFSGRARSSFVRNDTDWREAEISLDIPDTAVSLSYGVLMEGSGSVWIDNVSFESVGNYDPADADYISVVHHRPVDPQGMSSPQNLDFEQ